MTNRFNMDKKIPGKKPKKELPFSWLAINLRHLRKVHELSLDDVAYHTGLSKAYLSQIENEITGKVSIQNAKLIADYFDYFVDEICFKNI